jgi:hypothetical protein
MKMKKCFLKVYVSPAKVVSMVSALQAASGLLIMTAVLLIIMNRSSAQAVTVTPNSLTVTWTAPGDDSITGTASSYDIRYSETPLTKSNWGSATQVSGELLPKLAGSTESFTISGLSPGITYYVAIKTSDEAGNWSGISNIVSATTSILLGTDDEETNIPSDFQLHQNYPNPFNPNTTIEFSIPRGEHIQIAIFNILGERVTTLMSDYLTAGHHQVTWNGIDMYGRSVASGIYLYRFEAGSGVWTRKMTLLK